MRSESPKPERGRIWVTRAQPQAEATAGRLRALGFEPVVAPVLEIRPIAEAAIDLAGVDALAFTSAAGVSAFAALTRLRTLTVFAVGDATAEAAHLAGFSEVRSARGDAHALADLIATSPSPALVLNPSAADPAADLVALLADRGVVARAAVVYETREVSLDAAPQNLRGLLIHSPKAARVVARALAGADVSAIAAFAISPAAAAPLTGLGFHRHAVAASPNEAALLALLRDRGGGPCG
jgi:uroporphyrinogen-III synthase